jgi:hypothetical protein
MPKIIKTITNKSNNKAWINTNEYQNYFTQEQIDGIINPYTDYVQSLPGFISVNIEETSNTLVITHEFDTQENLEVALNNLGGPNVNSIVVMRNTLFTEKLQGLGANSTLTITFE